MISKRTVREKLTKYLQNDCETRRQCRSRVEEIILQAVIQGEFTV